MNNVASGDLHAPAEVVGVVPFWSQSGALNWDSQYAYLRRVLPALAAARPDWLWVVLWPQQTPGANWKYTDDGLFDHPRIVRYPWPTHTSMSLGILHFDAERYGDLETRYAPTLYWCNQIEIASHLLGGFTRSASRNGQPGLVGAHHYVIHKSLPYPPIQNWARRWLQTGGTLACDAVVCPAEYTLGMLRESLAELLNGATLQRALAKTQVLRFAPLPPQALDLTIRSHPKPVLVYNHRFESYKRPLLTLEVIEALRAGGCDFEVWVTQTHGQGANRFPVDRAVGHPDTLRYLRGIAVPAVNTLNTQHETFCISALDSLALGHILVAPNGLTFPELVPPGYPYLFDSVDQQRAMLGHIFRNWKAETEKWRPILRAWVREHFDLARYAGRYAALFDRVATEYRRPEAIKDHNWAASLAYLRALPAGTYPLHELANRYRMRTGLMAQAMPDRRVVRDFTNLGAGLRALDNRLAIDWPGLDETRLLEAQRRMRLVAAAPEDEEVPA